MSVTQGDNSELFTKSVEAFFHRQLLARGWNQKGTLFRRDRAWLRVEATRISDLDAATRVHPVVYWAAFVTSELCPEQLLHRAATFEVNAKHDQDGILCHVIREIRVEACRADDDAPYRLHDVAKSLVRSDFVTGRVEHAFLTVLDESVRRIDNFVASHGIFASEESAFLTTPLKERMLLHAEGRVHLNEGLRRRHAEGLEDDPDSRLPLLS